MKQLKYFLVSVKTTLLSTLQAQTLSGASPPMGSIHPFSKIAITFFNYLHDFDVFGDLEFSSSKT